LQMMKHTIIIITIAWFVSAWAQQPGDRFYVPKNHNTKAPALIITSCTGATKADLDSNKAVADSFGWIICTSAKTRNHRDPKLNDADIMKTYSTLVSKYQIDRSRVYLYGFSGQAVQAMMAVFLHPDKFKGAVAICAHAGAMPYANWAMLKDKHFYQISRERDWNLNDNKMMHQAFLENGVADTLVITPGPHGPKTRRELFEGCQWLNRPLP
jgi:predicted esterase